MINSSIGPSASKNSSLESQPLYNYRSEGQQQSASTVYFVLQVLKMLGGAISALILGPIAALGIVLWHVGEACVSACKHLIIKDVSSFLQMKNSFEKATHWMPLIIPGIAPISFVIDSYQYITKFNNKKIS